MKTEQFDNLSVFDRWDGVASLVRSGLDWSKGDLTALDILRMVGDGRMQLWIFSKEEIEAVMVTELLEYPQRKVCSIVCFAGRGMRGVFEEAREYVVNWALANGCEGIEARCRPSMVRMLARLGFNEKYTIVKLALAREGEGL